MTIQRLERPRIFVGDKRLRDLLTPPAFGTFFLDSFEEVMYQWDGIEWIDAAEGAIAPPGKVGKLEGPEGTAARNVAAADTRGGGGSKPGSGLAPGVSPSGGGGSGVTPAHVAGDPALVGAGSAVFPPPTANMQDLGGSAFNQALGVSPAQILITSVLIPVPGDWQVSFFGWGQADADPGATTRMIGLKIDRNGVQIQDPAVYFSAPFNGIDKGIRAAATNTGVSDASASGTLTLVVNDVLDFYIRSRIGVTQVVDGVVHVTGPA